MLVIGDLEESNMPKFRRHLLSIINITGLEFAAEHAGERRADEVFMSI
ncbi:hypothetical protein [Rhizobium leguminosarum]|nr:hypothetical protein [Rhizobium leguminosarum]